MSDRIRSISREVLVNDACFDNPIFQEEGNKFQNDEHVVQKDKNIGYEYSYNGGPGRQTEVHFRKIDQRQKNARIFASIVIAILLIALVITLIVVLSTKKDEDDTPTVLFRTNRIKGNLRIIQGPFSVYKPSLRDSTSEAYRYFSSSFIFKMNAIFHSSSYKSVYNSTIIDSFSSGSVLIHFTVTLKSSVDITSLTSENIQAMLIKDLDDSVFFIDVKSVKITPIAPPKVPSTVSPGVCQPVSIQKCINRTDYSLTSFPNWAGHKNLEQLNNDIEKYDPFMDDSCYAYSNLFFCSLLSPECVNNRRIPPCKQFCKDVRESCVSQINQTFPVDCDILPDSNDQNVCKQNPYKPAHCFAYKNTSFSQCWEMGYRTTAFPNYAGSISEANAARYVHVVITLSNATGCYKHAALLACSAFVPKCSGSEILGKHVIPPCRSLCEATKAGCEVFLLIFNVPWPDELNCTALPDVDDPSVCIGYREAHEPKLVDDCKSGELRCDGNTCIPSSWVCDGYYDCQDKSDEKLCATCPPAKELCHPVSGQCIPTENICDGVTDCYESVDEAGCIRLGDGTNSGILQVKDGVSSHWQEVCADDWNPSFSAMACKQLGYKNVNSRTEVTSIGTSLKSVISISANSQLGKDIDSMALQSYLNKSISKCSTGKVVNLTCANPVCGTRPANYESQLRIVNGDEVDPGTWPSQVSLHGGNNEAFYCGSSLIGHKWVLTAGHCVGGVKDGKDMVLKIGSTRRDTFSPYIQIRKAKRSFVHPNFNPMTVDNDIALIELEEPVYFNDYIRPICLPEPYYKTPEETKCYAIGWGRRNVQAKEYERAMKEVALYIVNWESCKKAIEVSPEPSSYDLTSNMMCAGGSRGHDSCQGDSGGPLMCRHNGTADTWYMAGVISWGIGCALPKVPGVYTNVSIYVNWVRNVTNGEIPYQ